MKDSYARLCIYGLIAAVFITLMIAIGNAQMIQQIDTALAQCIESVDSMRVEIRAIAARQSALEVRYNRHMLGHGIRMLPEGVFRAED